MCLNKHDWCASVGFNVGLGSTVYVVLAETLDLFMHYRSNARMLN